MTYTQGLYVIHLKSLSRYRKTGWLCTYGMKLYMEGISAVNNITKQGFNACDWTIFFIIYYIMDYKTALEKNLKICFAKLHGRLKKMVFCEKIQTRQTSLWNRYHFLLVF